MFLGEIEGFYRRLGRSLICAVFAGVVVAGCSADDVELNGKLFELAGMNNIGKRGPAPTVEERTGLVVPPDLNKLPDPNQPVAANPGDDVLASINDPDRAKVLSQEELERQQAVACKDYEFAKMRGDESTAINMTGPMGPCRQSVLTSVGQWMKPN